MICSAFLDDHLWLKFDPDFIAHDGLVVYDVNELRVLATKTPEQVNQTHRWKQVFHGNVVQ
jgi:hypothetical protein